MNKLRLTLKWRFTLLTIFIMTITSAVLVTAINYDIRKTMPTLTDTIINNISPSSGEIYGKTTLTPGSNGIVVESGIGDGVIEVAVGNAISNIYTTSLVAFFIIIILGAILTYLMMNKALKPIVDLNDNIKKINEDNLLCNLQIDGPYDEVKELTISFNQMLSKLDNAFTSQKRFNSRVAHELKTPLSVIKTNIDVLNDSTDRSIKNYKETIDLVDKSVSKMNLMIETLFDLIKQESAPLDEMVNIQVVLEDIVEDLNIIAKNNKINLEYEILSELDEIKGNEILLYRALYNVVENGIKYNTVNGNVSIVCKQENHNIRIEICDNGKGIEQKDISNIFEPFYRCEGINLSSSNGMGLGLSLTKSAIAIHGGDISVKSEVNKGSSFVINLPVLSI